jgi:hypothetical protein
LLDEARIRDLLELWREGIPQEAENRHIILGVDAIACQLLVTLCEDRNMHGLLTLEHLENHHMFSQFVPNSETFLQFIENHWNNAYPFMFVYQLQPVHPALPCLIIHVVPTLHGKGNAQMVEKLRRLKDILIQ